MTQEDRNLLLIDLCARLPYGVICNTDKGDGHLCSIDYTIFGVGYGINISPLKRDYFEVQEIKPYLRPMSDMTKDEEDLYCRYLYTQRCLGTPILTDLLDWLNAHHIDYRQLIEQGLALEAPVGMYNF